jgi:hypothetical protein
MTIYAQIIAKKPNGEIKAIRTLEDKKRLRSEYNTYKKKHPECAVTVIYSDFLNPLENLRFYSHVSKFFPAKPKPFKDLHYSSLEWWAKMPVYRAEKISQRYIKKPPLFLSKEEILHLYNTHK